MTDVKSKVRASIETVNRIARENGWKVRETDHSDLRSPAMLLTFSREADDQFLDAWFRISPRGTGFWCFDSGFDHEAGPRGAKIYTRNAFINTLRSQVS